MQDQRIEGIEIAALCIGDKSLFIHWGNFITLGFD
jgi:hypothetical protein